MPPHKRRLAWVSALLVTVALFTGAFVLQSRASTRGGDWARVETGDVLVGVEVTGELQATDSSAIGPPEVPQMWNFRIAMLAPEGSDVKKGQPVVGFDPSELEQRLQEKTAERDSASTEIEKRRASLRVESQEENLRLAEAQSRLKKAALKLEAPEAVINANERQQIELEHSLARREVTHRTAKIQGLRHAANEELRLLQAKLDAASREVERLQGAIAAMTVRSPRDGTVVYITDRRNEKIKVGDDTWRGRVLLQIPDLRNMRAAGEVDEADSGRVFANQKAVFRLDAHPDREWTARVTQVGHTVRRASNTNPNRTLPVQLTLQASDPAIMRPGMRFKGTLVTAERRSVVRIPVDSLFSSERGPTVRRRTALGVDEVPVEIGVRGDEWIEVISGISEGDEVMRRKISDEGEESA